MNRTMVKYLLCLAVIIPILFYAPPTFADSTVESVTFVQGSFLMVSGNASVKMEAGGPMKIKGLLPSVWVIRNSDSSLAKKNGWEVGKAYLETEEGKWQYLREVDINKSNDELAREFGVNTKKSMN